MSESKALQKARGQDLLLRSLTDLLEMGQMLAKSGLLPRNINTPEKAAAVLLVARDLGMSAGSILQGELYVVAGRVELTTKAMLSRIYASGEVDVAISYDDEHEAAVVTMTRHDCGASYTAIWDDEKITRTRSNIDPKTGKEKYTYTTFRRRMKLHRAVSECAQFLCPDVVGCTRQPYTVEAIEVEPVEPVIEYEEAEAVIEEAAPKPHWMSREKVRKRFWRWTGDDLGLTNEEVQAALGVESVYDFGGTMREAKDRIEEWVAAAVDEKGKDGNGKG